MNYQNYLVMKIKQQVTLLKPVAFIHAIIVKEDQRILN